MENCLRFTAVDGIGNIFVYFGIFFVACANGIVGYLIIENVNMYKNNITSADLSVYIMVFIGLGVGSVFMSIYG